MTQQAQFGGKNGAPRHKITLSSPVDKTNSVLKTKPYLKNIGPKNILCYSSEKLKQIRNEKSPKISKTKSPFKFPGFKNTHTEKTDPLIHRDRISVTHPAPPATDGACSLKSGVVDGWGEAQKLTLMFPLNR